MVQVDNDDNHDGAADMTIRTEVLDERRQHHCTTNGSRRHRRSDADYHVDERVVAVAVVRLSAAGAKRHRQLLWALFHDDNDEDSSFPSFFKREIKKGTAT